MTSEIRPWRSVLYVPASRLRAMDKARGLPTDAIIFDLEDAVAPDEKVAARAGLSDALSAGGFGDRARLVRINGLDTPWGAEDARAAGSMACDGVLVPKVNRAADLDAVAAELGDHPLWAMMETPEGILNARDIAMHPRLHGFVLGTNDLAKDLGARFRSDRMPLMAALQSCLLAARAAGILCIDGVFNAFKDTEGFAAECAQGRDMGMDGKSLIHPAQIDAANAAFSPSDIETDLAERQIAAFDAAVRKGEAVAVVDGRIVENLHVAAARTLLAKAAAIREREST